MVKRAISRTEVFVRCMTILGVLIIYPFVHIFLCIRAGMYGFRDYFIDEWHEGEMFRFMCFVIRKVSEKFFSREMKNGQ